MSHRLLLCALFASFAIAAPFHGARGADISWNSAANGNWGAGGSWTGGFTPSVNDTANFTVAGTYNATFTAQPDAILALLFNAPSGAVTLQSTAGTSRTLGVSAPGGTNRMFTLGNSAVNIGGSAANTPLNLYIVDGLFVANNSTLLARSESNINLIGGLNIGTIIDGNLTAGTATFTLNDEAKMQLGGNLAIASNASPGVNGVLNISGSGSSLTQYNNVAVGNITVGSIVGGTGAINLSTAGALTTGNGQLTINKTGTVTVNGTATLNANGNILIDGGMLNSTGNFNWATGRTMSVLNGGDVNFNVDTSTSANGAINVSGYGSTLTTTGMGIDLAIVGGTTVNVLSQGLLSTAGILSVGNVAAGGNGFLVASGIGTRVEALSTSASQFGANGNIADLTFSNQSVGSFAGGINICNTNTAGTTCYLTVESGADLINLGNVGLATVGGATTAATMTITGDGSSVTFGTNKTLTIGHASTGSATLNVDDKASLDVGSSGSTVLNDTGTINIDGGIVNLRTLTQSGGTINFNSGSLAYTGSLTIGAGGLLGTNLTMTNDHSLTLVGTATVNSGSLLLIESGAGFNVSTLTNNGQVILSGLDAVAAATTTNNAGLIRGEGRIVGAFNNNTSGELRAEPGKLILVQGANGTNAGRVNLLGGTAQFSSPLTNGAAGVITGRGTLIVGGAGLTNNGNVALSSGISDVFGDVNNSTGVMTRGVTISGNSDITFWDDVTNGAGSLFKVTSGSSATFFGTYSGAGITGGGNVYFEADISPGFSPAAVTFDADVSLASTANLKIELGGSTAGSQYDQVNVTGALKLDGMLTVTLINGFVPQFGQMFDFLNWGSLSGSFAAINLPALTNGWMWNTELLNQTGVIAVMSSTPGDLDGDGDVDGADFVAWQTNFPTASGATPAQGDADGDGDVDGADFVIWQTHFPFTPGSGSTPVPEPWAWLLMLAAMMPLYLFSRGSGRNLQSSPRGLPL
ncbi:MAG: hypothetical protein IT427_02945 [Pirellulales bacterium]|nr:hypothetical protein [Pirellulales bacterium]